jgi:cytochrome c oxidase assembly factor CtaG
VHGVEHAVLFGAALASWAAIVRLRRRRARPGIELLVLFALSLQCALLGALLTFATTAWYPAYAATTEPWGLSPLSDQQLAGVIMWIPAGGVYLVAALVVLRRWIGFGSGEAVDAVAVARTADLVELDGIGVPAVEGPSTTRGSTA